MHSDLDLIGPKFKKLAYKCIPLHVLSLDVSVSAFAVISLSPYHIKPMLFFKSAGDTPQVDTHWFSESGIIDVFVMLGPSPRNVFRQYSRLTGPTMLPPVSD